jgi:hypothetical protein
MSLGLISSGEHISTKEIPILSVISGDFVIWKMGMEYYPTYSWQLLPNQSP